MLVGVWVGSWYYVLLGLYWYHRGRVDGDFMARLARAAGTPNAAMEGLSDKMCGEAWDRFPHWVEGPDPKSDPGVPAHTIVSRSWYG